MRVFFLDDSGNKVRSDRERYFCLGGFSVLGEDVPVFEQIQSALWALHDGLGLPGDELKFAHIGSDRDTKRKPNPLVRIGLDFTQRQDFILHALDLIASVPSLEIVASLVDKRVVYGDPPFVHAFKVLVERCEHSLRDKETHGLLFCDDENKQEKPMRELLSTGFSEYVSFIRIKETIAFIPSKESPGIQFADLVTGSIARAANFSDWRYLDRIISRVRKSNSGNWRGHGIKVYPRGNLVRKPEKNV